VGVSIGTAGWSIPTAFAGDFPADGSHLERYAQVFPAVEINSSFHRPRRRTTYERWAASVPRGFRFSVKIPKTISHTARFVDCANRVDAFLAEAGGLGDKLDVLLLQLPPSFAYDEATVAGFLKGFRRRLSSAVRIACEPRHVSWSAAEADACLAEHRVARVAADPVLVPDGERPAGWDGFAYHRLHGAPRIYHSAYGAPRLEALAESLRDGAWCIFDNTASGAATGNALTVRDMVPHR
jgi:uncharacterized protein YecE (DUF72 family)